MRRSRSGNFSSAGATDAHPSATSNDGSAWPTVSLMGVPSSETTASNDAGEYAWIASIASITASSDRSAPSAISLIVGDRPRSCHSVSNVR